MLQLPADVTVFISSTFRDLHVLRQETVDRLREVFGARLIAMETFGTDEAPPDVSSVRRVSECDIFVGIYARRYGTIEPVSGKSITELELEEAERAFSAGRILGLMLYLLNDTAAWDPGHCDQDPTAVGGLRRLQERISRHTPVIFSRAQDLPFLVIRDLLSQLLTRFQSDELKVRRFQGLPPPAKITRPPGMEFLRSFDSEYLVGRQNKIEEVVGTVREQPITLLLGNSGVGKTSLIHAGVFPSAVKQGWIPVYSRPFGLPRGDVCSALEAAIFEGRPSHRGSLPTLVAQALGALEGASLLLVIDQFEDVLASREPWATSSLIGDLQELYRLPRSRFSVLICYRADLEGRLGQFWQQISGDPAGLPRVYLTGISQEAMWEGITHASSDLEVDLRFSTEDKVKIGSDILVASEAAGEKNVYPPYAQILLEHIWRASGQKGRTYQIDDYDEAGGANGIIGTYLSNSLAYAHDREGNAQKIIVALVKSYGERVQRSIQDIAGETGIAPIRCEEVLEQLIDLRLVRHVQGNYEVTHDFVAREVLERLVAPEERELKRCLELLASKAAAFATTGARINQSEMAFLYKFREKIRPSEQELRLILASWLREDIPGLFWLISMSPETLIKSVQQEDSIREFDDEQRAAASLLLRRVSGVPLDEAAWAAFRYYKLGVELAVLLREDPFKCPNNTLLWALRAKKWHVRTAAYEVVRERVTGGDWSLIPRLGKSTSRQLRSAYERLATDPKVLEPMAEVCSSEKVLQEFVILKRLASGRSRSVRAAFPNSKSLRLKARSALLASALVKRARSGIEGLLTTLEKASANKVDIVLNVVGGPLDISEFESLLDAFRQANVEEARRSEATEAGGGNRRLLRFSEQRTLALAEAIWRSVSKNNICALRDEFQTMKFTTSAWPLALALATFGETEDIELICKRVAEEKRSVQYWQQITISRALAERLAVLGNQAPSWMVELLDRREFWEYQFATERLMNPEDSLPIINQDNRQPFIRFVAHVIAGCAGPEDLEVLCRLARHDYRMVARTGAIRLVMLAGRKGIELMQRNLGETIDSGGAESFSIALRDAEVHLYGLLDLW